MVGKTLKSKINGKLFYVKELRTVKDSRTEKSKQYYVVCEAGKEKEKGYEIEKGWFEKGYMQNLEVVE